MPHKVYYDTVATGTSATVLTFFAHNEADDGETVTNLATDNQLPEPVEIRKIELIPAGDIDISDAIKLTENAVIKVIVGTNEVIKFPAALALTSAGITFMPDAGSSGTNTYTRLSSTLDGFELEEPIVVDANTKINVKLVLGSAFGTDTNLTMCLHCRTR